jgi:hypothetical protein
MATSNAHGTPDAIGEVLSRVRKRVVAGRVLADVSVHLLAALSLLAAFLLAERLLGFVGLDLLRALLIVAGLVIVVTAVRAFWTFRLSLFDAAVLADDRLRLKERLSSALYLEGSVDPLRGPGWSELVRRDGVKSLEGADIRGKFPLRLPRSARWLPAPAVLAVVFALLPPIDLLGIQQERQIDEAMRAEVARKKDELRKALEQLRKEAEKPPDPEVQKALEALEKKPESLADETKKEEPPPGAEEAKREALVEFSRLEESLKKALDARRFDDLKDFLDKFPPGSLTKSPLTGAIREALKEGDFTKAGLEMKKIEDLLAELAKKGEGGKELSKEDLEKLAKLQDEMAKLAKDSRFLSKLSKGLENLKTNLSPSDLAKALRDLEALRKELGDLDSLARDLKLLEDALELSELSQEDLANLHRCPNCGKVSSDPSGAG